MIFIPCCHSFVYTKRGDMETILISLTLNDLKNLIRESFQEIIDEQNEPAQAKNFVFMNAKEAADFLNMAMPTIYRYVNRNQIPYLIKGRLYFRMTDLVKWLENSNHQPSKIRLSI